MKRLLSLFAVLALTSSLTGCCLLGHGMCGPCGGCSTGACGTGGYPSGGLYGGPSAATPTGFTNGPVATGPFYTTTAAAPLENLPPL